MITINSAEFAKRRQSLMEKIGTKAVAIISAAPECLRNGDSFYPYRQNSNFYYLTGFTEPEAIAVFIPGRKEGEYILFSRPHDAAQEVWTGARAGQEGARANYGAAQAFPISEFKEKLPELLLGRQRIFYSLSQSTELSNKIMSVVNQLSRHTRSGLEVPFAVINLEHWLNEMRLFKSPAEIALMRKAADISVQAHKRAMQLCKPGMFEYQLEAEMLHEFYQQGSRACAYNSIVGSGSNTCILHYNDNNAELTAGDLVLIDAACEYQHYAADITRTFPVSGRFSSEQSAIYEIVLQAQLAAIEVVRPGASWIVMQEACARVITEGLVKLGILKGKVDELVNEKAYMPFYMHHSGHWLGLDVHDVGAYKIEGQWRPLQPGMVFTIEPGIYIPANSKSVDPKWWDIGVRIEDDVLVTEQGCDVLTAALPKTITAIEALMADAL